MTEDDDAFQPESDQRSRQTVNDGSPTFDIGNLADLQNTDTGNYQRSGNRSLD